MPRNPPAPNPAAARLDALLRAIAADPAAGNLSGWARRLLAGDRPAPKPARRRARKAVVK